MKILIVRHGEPDYSIDSLTEKGWKEAEYLSERLTKLDVAEFYVSTLARAKDTLAPTLKKNGRKAIECEWLKEFPPTISKPNRDDGCSWDWLPEEWTKHEEFFDRNNWYENEIMKAGKVGEEYKRVTGEFDKLLEKHGYKREGNYYRAVKPNNDTLVLTCHFGLESVLLSHILNISPMLMWHGFCALPTSVTTLVTEERRPGIAYFRTLGFGDISHLYKNDEEPSFAARFCEMYDNEDERHD